MWIPDKLIIKNLLSHSDSELKIRNGKSTMIFGINIYDKGADSNGGGKSVILEGITLALTGELNRNISKDEMIKDGEKDCFVQLDLFNNTCDIKKLTIKRFFKYKKTSKIELWENDEQNKEITSINEANNRIYDLIGINKKDLLKFFILGQENNYSFLQANDDDKKDIIGRFVNSENVIKIVDLLKEERKEDVNALDILLQEINKHENKIEFIDEQIKKILENSFKNIDYIKLKKENTELENKIVSIKEKIQKNEILFFENEKNIKKIKIDNSNKISINDEIDIFSKEIRNAKKSLNEKLSQKNKMDILLKNKIECPKCNHEFSLESDLSITEIEKEINKLVIDIDACRGLITRLKNDLKELELKILEEEDKIKKQKQKKEKLIFDNNSIDDKIKTYKRRIKNLNYVILDNSEKLNKKDESDEVKKFDKEKFEINLKLKDLQKEKNNIDKSILDKDFWIQNFGKRGFFTFLINKSIKKIEGITNSYLNKMNSDLRVVIDGFSILKSGDIREKISVSVFRDNDEFVNFNRLSGGEKARIKLANIIGLQHLINLTANNGGLDFLGLDEVFEGLDETGQIDILNILDKLNITSLIITHRSRSIGAMNEIFVLKNNNGSKLYNNKNKIKKLLEKYSK